MDGMVETESSVRMKEIFCAKATPLFLKLVGRCNCNFLLFECPEFAGKNL